MNLAARRPKNRRDSFVGNKISMITLEEKPKALQGECMAQRKSKTEMERNRMISYERNSDWAAMYGINSQLESQQSELHHANHWACQAR